MGELEQGLRPLLVGRERGLEVGKVVRHRARGVGSGGEQRAQTGPLRLAAAHQVARRDHHALFRETAGIRGHRARTLATDFGMVGAIRGIANELRWVLWGEDRGDHRDVGQVGATVGRVVGHGHVARTEREQRAHLAHAQPERTEVDRDVRRVDHQVAVRVEQRAGKVEALAHVGRKRGALQHLAHVCGN